MSRRSPRRSRRSWRMSLRSCFASFGLTSCASAGAVRSAAAMPVIAIAIVSFMFISLRGDDFCVCKTKAASRSGYSRIQWISNLLKRKGRCHAVDWLAVTLHRSRRRRWRPMIHREKVPTAWEGCEISVVTERLGDGRWAVVAGISQTTPEHTRTVDLPVPSETFATEEEAKAYGMLQAGRRLEKNMPQTEAVSARSSQ